MSLCAKFHTFVPICAMVQLTALTIEDILPDLDDVKVFSKVDLKEGTYKLKWMMSPQT